MIFLLIRKLRIAGLRLCGRWFLFLRKIKFLILWIKIVLNGVIHRQALGLVDFGLVSFGIYMRILRIICGGKQQEK